MKTKLMMMGALAATCAVCELAAMPTAEETRQAVPVVEKLLAPEHEALKAGRKTRSEVAVAAMKLAGETDTAAAKLLLMKGAFVLYVQDGKLEKAAETMNAIRAAIPDMPPQSVTNMIEAAHLGASKKEDCARLYKLIDGAKAKNNGPAGSDDRMATVDGYTWSYRVRNDEATIVAEKDGKPCCAVSPRPTGDLMIPATLGGVKVTRIGFEAFRNCDELTSVTIPEGVTHIDTHALAYCGGLKSVSLPSSLRDIGYAAFGKDMELKSVTIPNGVRSIAADAFNGCLKVKSLVIPESVTNIKDHAFLRCDGLKSITIPSSVKNIGVRAFEQCAELTEVKMLGERPEAPENLFFPGCGKLKAIHVPANAKSWAGMKDWFGIPLVFDAK